MFLRSISLLGIKSRAKLVWMKELGYDERDAITFAEYQTRAIICAFIGFFLHWSRWLRVLSNVEVAHYGDTPARHRHDHHRRHRPHPAQPKYAAGDTAAGGRGGALMAEGSVLPLSQPS